MDSLIIFILGSISGFVIYSLGIRQGIELEKGHKPKSIITKIKEKKEVAVAKEDEEILKTAFENLMSYDGSSQKVER